MRVYNIDEASGLAVFSEDGSRPREVADDPFCVPGTAVTVGMFDGVHLGHRHILATLAEVARRDGLRPVVVTFDNHPRQVLSADAVRFSRITTNEERNRLLEACGVCEVAVLHFTPALAQLSACEFLQQVLVGRLHARVLVLGFDNMFGNKGRNDFGRVPALAASLGVRVVEDTVVLCRGGEVSSTRIRRLLDAGDVAEAAQLLGGPYSVSGHVVAGRQVGRQIGFPTANVQPDSELKMLPAEGVYAVRMRLSGGTAPYAAMANVGAQPTFGSDHPALEVNLLDFDGDLYGQPATVEFMARLRDIRRFESGAALAAQLACDREAVRTILGLTQ